MIKGLLKLFCGGGETQSSCAAKAGSPVGKVQDLENFVDYVVKALVDYPNEVSVKTELEKDVRVIKITCNKSDVGKVVGKRGKTIMAIRALVSGAAGRLQERVSVEVMD